jgi:hypothetical protein
MDLFMSLVHLHGGPAPVRRFLPEHMELIANGDIQPGKVFDQPSRSRTPQRAIGRSTSVEPSRPC